MRTRCVTIEKESRKLASPLFHSQRMLASFLPHHLPSLRRLLWNTLASCQSSISLIDTFYWDRSFQGLSYWDLFSIRITCLLWDSSCETLSQAAREAGRQTEQVQTQKRLLASFVFVASPVCVDKYIELRLLWFRQTVWNPNSWLGFGTKTFVAATGILCYVRVLFLETPRWIKHSFCSYPHEGLCKGIWICSYTQYATGSRNRTSSSSTN